MPPQKPDSSQVDLHGMPPEQAFRKLAQALHSARVQRLQKLLVITGKGWGNREQKPILRGRVEDWLRGPEGKRLGVRQARQVHRGGALEVDLGTREP